MNILLNVVKPSCKQISFKENNNSNVSPFKCKNKLIIDILRCRKGSEILDENHFVQNKKIFKTVDDDTSFIIYSCHPHVK